MQRPSPALAGKPPAVKTAADPSLCPRCGHKLLNPDSLGWCSKCGYCRSIAEEAAAQCTAPPGEGKAPAPPSALGTAELAQTVRLMPAWSWPLVGGVAVILVASFAGNAALPAPCLGRAAWATGQLLVGAVSLLLAQLWVILLVGARQEGLGARDVFLPGRVWRAAVRHLPETRKPVWVGAWAATGLVCSVAVLGGFDYWLGALRPPAEERRPREADEAGKKKEGGTADGKGAAKEGQTTAQCSVIGYQADGSGNVTALVVATTAGDRLQLAGVVSDGLTPEVSRALGARLARMKQTAPLIPGLKMKGTVWVRPGVFCDVDHRGGAGGGELPGARLRAVAD